ncbi:MAG: radical SAM protein [Desulfobacteraceae bacterium]|nr:radical SAM protein [Desulfobacteraceae bacterium]
MKSLLTKFKYLIFLFKNKGFLYTYNAVHFYIFWSWIREHPLLIKLLYWLAPYPSYIEIEVTTRCNLRCIICERTYWNEPNKDMSFKEVKYIVDQFPKLKWIGLTGIGESFVNKDFMKMLRYIKSKNVIVELYDNFYFIDENTAREIIELQIDNIFVSFDAATKETYEKIRVGSNFERVVNNVRRFIQLKREENAFFPQLSFHYIVNKMNIHEIPLYIELIHSINNGKPVTIQFSRMLHEFEETKGLFAEVSPELIELAEKKAKELGVRVVWNLDVPISKPPVKHCIEWTMPFIFVTGHVIPCCSGNEAGQRKFQKKTSLGNVFETSFKKIWYGEKYKSLRRQLSRGKVPAPCKDCCLYNVGVKPVESSGQEI